MTNLFVAIRVFKDGDMCFRLEMFKSTTTCLSLKIPPLRSALTGIGILTIWQAFTCTPRKLPLIPGSLFGISKHD